MEIEYRKKEYGDNVTYIESIQNIEKIRKVFPKLNLICILVETSIVCNIEDTGYLPVSNDNQVTEETNGLSANSKIVKSNVIVKINRIS
jgi:hypothetical protein